MYSSHVINSATSPGYILLIIIGISTLYCAFCWLVYPRYFSPLRHIPGPPLENTILGHFRRLALSESGGSIQSEWAQQYGGMVRTVGPLGQERLMVLRPEALHKILVSDWVNYPRPGFLRNLFGLLAGYGLLTVTGNDHRQMRKAMSPAFSSVNLMARTDMYYRAINNLVGVVQSLVSGTSKGKVIPLYGWMSKVALDMICETAFGYDSNSLLNPQNELAKAYKDLLELQSGINFVKFSALVAIPGMPRFLASDIGYKFRNVWKLCPALAPVTTFINSIHCVRRISRDLLAEKLAHDIENMSTGNDIMSLLVRARQRETKGGYKLSEEALVDQVLTFVGAGQESIATSLCWMFWLLAINPVYQQKLREEVAPIFAETDRPDYRVLKDLKMLDCVVMESLRILPPVFATTRVAEKSDWIDGVYVPKGTQLHIPLRTINTREEIWGPDADQFRPERWLNLRNTSFSMMSFIAGPHACIGKAMSISEMKTVLAALVANFEFAPSCEGQVARPTNAVTMKPADDMPLLVTAVRR
ncbi:cytochrome P450 [Auriscalpium vulgare]|uniref:Cytochrome P450 n=1 Tax=Auriscalpium vulgare TaxID=40419 RepID=A0ACB8RF34_9AGAM|nr:cytochrome P450 [Auriscalpium vulgare]